MARQLQELDPFLGLAGDEHGGGLGHLVVVERDDHEGLVRLRELADDDAARVDGRPDDLVLFGLLELCDEEEVGEEEAVDVVGLGRVLQLEGPLMDQLAARGSQAARQWRLDVQVLVRAQQLVYFVGGAHNSFVCIGVTSLISYYDKNK